MITAYTGAPGSGKSLDMCRQIVQAIRFGRKVVCNMDIVLPRNLRRKQKNLFCVENEEITPAFLRSFATKHHKPRKESQTLVVVDECQLKFSDTFMTKGTAKPWLEFFSQHRKMGYDFLMVTPSIRSGLIRDVRDIVEIEVTHWKMTNYPTKGVVSGLILLIIALLPINVFMSVSQWKAMPDRKNLIRRLFLYKPRYAKMYDTYKIYDVTEQAKKQQEAKPPVLGFTQDQSKNSDEPDIEPVPAMEAERDTEDIGQAG
jgi:hypothetical protein